MTKSPVRRTLWMSNSATCPNS